MNYYQNYHYHSGHPPYYPKYYPKRPRQLNYITNTSNDSNTLHLHCPSFHDQSWLAPGKKEDFDKPVISGAASEAKKQCSDNGENKPSNTNESRAKKDLDNQINFIKLNIGGHKFTTKLSTLLSFPGSHLHEIFSDLKSIPTDADGYFFLDRDGSYFQHILNFLRDGMYPPSTLTNTEVEMIRREAKYYRLPMIWNSANESAFLSMNQQKYEEAKDTLSKITRPNTTTTIVGVAGGPFKRCMAMGPRKKGSARGVAKYQSALQGVTWNTSKDCWEVTDYNGRGRKRRKTFSRSSYKSVTGAKLKAEEYRLMQLAQKFKNYKEVYLLESVDDDQYQQQKMPIMNTEQPEILGSSDLVSLYQGDQKEL